MNRKERRAQEAKSKKRYKDIYAGSFAEIQIEPDDYHKIKNNKSAPEAFDLMMDCIRAVAAVPGGIFSDEELFRGTAVLIEREYIKVFMHFFEDHVDASLHLRARDGSFFQSKYVTAVNIVTEQ